MQEIYKVNNIIEINYNCRNYCKIPYQNHKNGCPNFNKHIECPPNSKLVEQVFDFNKDLFFIIEEFDLKSHVNYMRQKHPEWTNAQLKNLLYWQSGVRKRLKNKVKSFINNKDMIYTLLPESMGIMVINTAIKLNIPIEKDPVNKIYKIALVGYKLNNKQITFGVI